MHLKVHDNRKHETEVDETYFTKVRITFISVFKYQGGNRNAPEYTNEYFVLGRLSSPFKIIINNFNKNYPLFF